MGDPIPRCGDHVHHHPSGENWLVAWAEGAELAPAGWPTTIARLADCKVTRRCSDEEHVAAVRLRLVEAEQSRRGFATGPSPAFFGE